MTRSVRRRALLALAVALMALAGPTQLSSGDARRDLYPKRFNPDDTVICAEWCGLFEPCC